MTRPSTFNSPYLLGFDQIERLLDRVAKSGNDGYPPYNIEQRGPAGLRITLAVAGFTRAELAVTVEDNHLVIRGRRDEEDNRVYLHRGIATRQFQRSFVLAEGLEVGHAELAHGLLHIDLRRIRPNMTIQTIDITDGEPGSDDRPDSRS